MKNSNRSRVHRYKVISEFKESLNIGPIEIFTELDGSFDLFTESMKPYNDDGSNPREVGICTTLVDRSFTVNVNGHEIYGFIFFDVTYFHDEDFGMIFTSAELLPEVEFVDEDGFESDIYDLLSSDDVMELESIILNDTELVDEDLICELLFDDPYLGYVIKKFDIEVVNKKE